MSQCSGSTKKGARCKQPAAGDSPFCVAHQDQAVESLEVEPVEQPEPEPVALEPDGPRFIVMRRMQCGERGWLSLGDHYPDEPSASLLSRGWVREVRADAEVTVTGSDDACHVMIDDEPLIRHTLTSERAESIAASIRGNA